MDELVTVPGGWREALTIIWRYPLATLAPAVVLAALGDAPYYFLKGSGLGWEEVLTFITAAFAYYLYVAYVEEIVVEAERGTEADYCFMARSYTSILHPNIGEHPY